MRFAAGLGVAGAVCLAIWGLTVLFPGSLSSRDDWSKIAYQIGFVVLMSLGLFSRQLKFGQVARYALIWAAVFAALGVGYAYRGSLLDAGLKLRSELIPSYALPAGPHELVLSQDDGGGYSVVGQVNGKPVRFTVDTGASDIVLAPADAARLGLDVVHLNYSRHFETANGVGEGAAYTAARLSVGPIAFSNVDTSINRAPMGTSLLGMAFLHRLSSYEVKDGRLLLRWR